jgi:hypothetical protein
MKSRHLPAMESLHQRRMRRLFWILALILVGIAGAALAQEAGDPPARAAYLSFKEGGVVVAPQGDNEWMDLPQNRPLTVGDRIWTDRGARAELQLGSATLHLDGESQVGVSDLDALRAQFVVQQGTLNLRVRELLQGENMEIDTPNLALRALQPGDYRIDVDPRSGQTRVTVQSGLVSLFGESGDSIQMGAAQQANFAGRFLAQVDGPPFSQDDFGLWAAERNGAEDASQATRYVPRGVVGATELDPYGTWSQEPDYGAVWYPTVTVANWAPYRYGHWDWISPWGWTWVDDEPWGFAPFHYGRWTMIGTRWAWVPGRMVARPVYSPALVAFFGGGGADLAIGSGPSVGWYPLAPGEAWWPVYHASRRYVNYANVNINLNAYPRNYQNHFWRNRPLAVTAVHEDVFRRGSAVERHWQPVSPQAIGRARFNVVPPRPDRHERGEFQRPAPRGNMQPMTSVQPPVVQPGGVQRLWGGATAAPAVREAARVQPQQRIPWERQGIQQDQQRQQWDQHLRAQRDQQRQPQWDQQQQRVQRDQQRQQWQAQQAARQQQQQAAVQRAQQEQAGRVAQERAQREAWRQQRDQQRMQAPQPAMQPRAQPPQAQPQQPQQSQQQQQQQQQGAPARGNGGGHRDGQGSPWQYQRG